MQRRWRCTTCGTHLYREEMDTHRCWVEQMAKAKRRQFGRGYAPNPPSGRYSHQHKELARVVTMNAVCAWIDRGGCAGPLEADHIVPRSQGGESTRDNLRPLCRRHNRQRGIETKNENRNPK